MIAELPTVPDNDSDFTPDLARKIIAKYQELLQRSSERTEQWRSLATRLAKQHEPYVPMFPSDAVRARSVSGALLDEIYRLEKAGTASVSGSTEGGK